MSGDFRTEDARKLAKSLKIDFKKVQHIQLEGAAPDERGTFFSLPNGKKVYISPFDMDFVNQLRKLPASTRIKIIGLSENEIEKHLSEERTNTRQWLIEVLNKVWYWRETGEQASDLSELLPGTQYGQHELLKRIKKGSKMTRAEMQNIIDWFLNDNSEVYSP